MSVDQVRTSRAQRQAQTREKLIAVAREMFLDVGYAASSLDKVAVAAGFSKGAVYSNFSGKEELCMAVLDSIHDEQIEGVMEAFTADADLDGRIDAFTAWAREGLGQPRWTALEVEFAAVARQSPYVARELVKRHREISEALADLIRRVTKEAGIELPMDAERRQWRCSAWASDWVRCARSTRRSTSTSSARRCASCCAANARSAEAQ